ncbi:MAG: SEL1-like repeat protein [Sulfuricaulis sp.]
MHSRPDALLSPFRSAGKYSWLLISLSLLFLLASQLAPLMSPSYMWDDLVWYWTFSKDGTERLFQYLAEVGHPVFWFFLDVAYRYFGEHGTFPTSMIAIFFHLLNAVLLTRLLIFSGASRIQAFSVFLLYLLSPYYFNRGTVSHYFYDIFMFFFLGSVFLGMPGKKRNPSRTAVAVFSQILSFGLPTLVMLEPLRLFVYWMRCKGDRKKFVRSVYLYCLVAVVCAFGVFHFFRPTGYYEGYNEIRTDPGRLGSGLQELIAYMPGLAEYHLRSVHSVLASPHDWLIVATLLVLTNYVVWRLSREYQDFRTRSFPAALTVLGVFLIISGGVPYVLAGRGPTPWDFNSRLFYVSGVGLVITLAALASWIPLARLRMLAITGAAAFLMISNLGQAKTYLYDHAVRQSILAGLEKNEAIIFPPGRESTDIFIVLTSEPGLGDILFQRRYISPVEFSVPSNYGRTPSAGKKFIYYYDSRNFLPPDLFLPTRTSNCSLAAHDRHPCPNRYLVANYQAGQNGRIDKVAFLGLFAHVFLDSAPGELGSLDISVPPRPFNRDEMTLRWYQRSAELGVPGSQNIVGEMHQTSFYNLPPDAGKAAEWFRKAVAGGSRDARVNLGMMYLGGRGVEQDVSRGVGLIRSAADDGYARAQYHMGILYGEGKGVVRDEIQALAWFHKAAKGGYPIAQLHLGLMYAGGNGVSRDIREAVRWLRQGASRHDSVAQYHLAMICAKEPAAECGMTESIDWLNKSALQGFALAQRQLAHEFEHGVAVPRDIHLAYFWFKVIALRETDTPLRTEANRRLAQIRHDLSESDRLILEGHARSWRPVSRQNTGASQ